MKIFFGPHEMSQMYKLASNMYWSYTDGKCTVAQIFKRSEHSYSTYCYVGGSEHDHVRIFHSFEEASLSLTQTLISLGYVWLSDHYKALL